MKKNLLPLIYLFWISPFLAAAAPHFTFTPKLRLAYQRAMELRMDESTLLLSELKTTDPDNHLIYFVENYLDFMRVFIDEDKKEFDLLDKNKQRRLDIIEDGDEDSPYYLYTQAEIKLQWALLHLKFDEYLAALSNIRSAYKLLNKNLEKHPDFIASKKSLGVLHALVGTIPDQFKWAVKLLSGMEGSIAQGTQEIESVVIHYQQTNDALFEQETLILYAFLMLHLNNSSNEKAWTILTSGNLNPNKSPLACFALSNMAMRIGKNDEAIQMIRNKPTSPEFYPLPYLDFMLGLAKFRRLDADAPKYLHRYIDRLPGGNYVKEAYQKLAWHSLLNSDPAGYKRYMEICRTQGRESVSSDKSAQTEAENGPVPNPILLKARVLFDGGYYARARELLKTYTSYDFVNKGLQLEYIYRQGRIAHELQQTADALYYYDQTIKKGRDEKYYYACNAALKSGLLYEEQGKKALARSAYEACLDMSPNQYERSLHSKAKAGLNRINQ